MKKIPDEIKYNATRIRTRELDAELWEFLGFPNWEMWQEALNRRLAELPPEKHEAVRRFWEAWQCSRLIARGERPPKPASSRYKIALRVGGADDSY